MAKVSLTLLVRKEKKGYSALCPELDVASQGKTEEVALQRVREAIDLYIESMVELGRFDVVLEQLNLLQNDLRQPLVQTRTHVHRESILLPA